MAKRFPIRRHVNNETVASRIKRVSKRVAVWFALFAVLTSFVSAAVFVVLYDHYSQIVEKRVASGFWHSRGGIYASPHLVRRNQSISAANVVEMLRRSGYVEGKVDGNVWNGSFTINNNEIEITTSNSYDLRPEIAKIKFAGDKIAYIESDGVALDDYSIEAEMLAGRSETKRGKNRVLRYEEIPQNLRNAILAAEDQRFFEHRGIDTRGIVRATLANLRQGEIKQGGSTITQQLVKNTFLTPEKSFSRKFAEAFLAVALENKMSKEDILAVYCNEIYLGQYGASGVHGVEQAARAYFDKDLNDLTLSESATIAAMIKNPNLLAPHKNPEDAKARREWIITRMLDSGVVSNAEAESAFAQELALAEPKSADRSIAPYFVDAVTRELTTKFENDYMNSNFNTRVYTTIDTQIQVMAERSVTKHLAGLDKIYARKGLKLQATIIAIDPRTGHVLAMVGGRDYKESQFNRATDARRAPGSTFKPFVYATAFEQGYTPISLSADRPTEFMTLRAKPYKPANYGDSYTMNNITLKAALVKSSNVVAVKTAMDVGLHAVSRKAESFGFDNINAYPSMALGTMEVTPLQLAAAYCVFANGGKRVDPTFINKIVSGSGKTLYLSVPDEKQIIKEQTAYMITDALEAVVARGTARKASGALGKNVAFAGKTGSSKDGWFVGYTPNLVTVAWVGLDNNDDIHSTGGDVALPLWTDFMKSVVEAKPELGGSSFKMPKGLTEVIVDPETGMMAGHSCPQSERVVVPTSNVSYVECLRHQPMTQMLVAMTDESESVPNVMTIEAVGAELGGEGDNPVADSKVDFTDYTREKDQLRIQRQALPAADARTPPPIQRPTDESYFDGYLRANSPKRKTR